MAHHLSQLFASFADQGCGRIYVKTLRENDNSKNQVYFGGGYEAVSIFPASKVYADHSGKAYRSIFKAALSFSWLDEDGNAWPAPRAQFILYPQYPEVRFSGFLAGCKQAPSNLMTVRQAGRVLFIGVNDRTKALFGKVVEPDHPIAREMADFPAEAIAGVFKRIILRGKKAVTDTRAELLEALRE
ncbi:MAG: MvaI/BcnI restriction endonuclease family protein, partial [Bacteroidota bacterium]